MSLEGSSGQWELDRVRLQVAREAARVARQGEWPAWISPDSLNERIPPPGGSGAGFDAGIACALDLIPRERQRLASVFHAAYTPEAVAQARQESREMRPESETTWWLSACHLCREGENTEADFRVQLTRFQQLGSRPERRRQAAREAHREMLESFEVREGVAWARRDGGAQGAYLAGHPLAVVYAPEYRIYFLSTFRPSLGLEGFKWADPDREGVRGSSGPVHGSRQFVRCRDQEELRAALALARKHLE